MVLVFCEFLFFLFFVLLLQNISYMQNCSKIIKTLTQISPVKYDGVGVVWGQVAFQAPSHFDVPKLQLLWHEYSPH